MEHRFRTPSGRKAQGELVIELLFICICQIKLNSISEEGLKLSLPRGQLSCVDNKKG